MAVRADLHCHSTHSDGTLDPKQIVALAKEIGLHGLAITDHDTISSFEEAKKWADEQDIKLITGVELSCVHEGISTHVLGYAFNPKNHALVTGCEEHQKLRIERNRKILEKLKSAKMPVEEREMIGIGTIGRPHIAQAMVKRGYVASLQEAFSRFIGDGKPCYVPGERWSIAEAIDLIHGAEGKVVLAHPHLCPGRAFVRKLLEMPFDGLEAFYSNFDAKTNALWQTLAHERSLLATGGSDFHGEVKPHVRLGSALTPESVFTSLYTHFLQVI